MLRLDKIEVDKTASGQVINLMSNDVSRFDILLTYFHYIWITPFQVSFIFQQMSCHSLKKKKFD